MNESIAHYIAACAWEVARGRLLNAWLQCSSEVVKRWAQRGAWGRGRPGGHWGEWALWESQDLAALPPVWHLICMQHHNPPRHGRAAGRHNPPVYSLLLCLFSFVFCFALFSSILVQLQYFTLLSSPYSFVSCFARWCFSSVYSDIVSQITGVTYNRIWNCPHLLFYYNYLHRLSWNVTRVQV